MRSSMLGNLSAIVSDTLTDSIQMIDIDELHESADNFFIVENIESFANTILGQGGVKDNLIVRPLETGGYEIISGHRRRAAVQFLLDRGDNISRYLPCLVQNYANEDDKLLDLILMNVSARQISDAELWQCYETIDKILKDKKDKGEYYGRIRDDIAKSLGVSSAQVGKMQNIEKNAIESVKEAVASGELSISTANEIAKLDEAEQKAIASEDLSTVKPKELKKAPETTVKWDGELFADIVKERMLEWLTDEEKEKAQDLDNNEYSEYLKKNHRHSGYCHDGISIDGSSSKIELTFYKPIEDSDIRTITLTWAMAAKFIRKWLAEEADTNINADDVACIHVDTNNSNDYEDVDTNINEEKKEALSEKEKRAIKGYCLLAAEICSFSKEQKNMLLGGLIKALANNDIDTAESAFTKY